MWNELLCRFIRNLKEEKEKRKEKKTLKKKKRESKRKCIPKREGVAEEKGEKVKEKRAWASVIKYFRRVTILLSMSLNQLYFPFKFKDLCRTC